MDGRPLDDMLLFVKVEPVTAILSGACTAGSVGLLFAGIVNIIEPQADYLFPAAFCSIAFLGALSQAKLTYRRVCETIKHRGLDITVRGETERRYARVYAERSGILNEYDKAVERAETWQHYVGR